MNRIPFLDSHTGGEPTRLIQTLPFDLGMGSVAEKLSRLKADHDDFRRTVLNEPRGSDVLVGAYLVPPADPTCEFGVIFFNNVGYLGMCGHGTIGVIASLAYLGQVNPGRFGWRRRSVWWRQPCMRTKRKGVIRIESRSAMFPPSDIYPIWQLKLDGKVIHGDVAWGGNWFFLCHDHGLDVSSKNLEQLSDFAMRTREAYTHMGLTGLDGAEIDHVELFAPTPDADSRSFVLCPGKSYDRSPCGTGTSAKLACLYADGKLDEGQVWKQQSVIGSIFEGQVQALENRVIPTITGEAWVMAQGELLMDERDPFKSGIHV